MPDNTLKDQAVSILGLLAVSALLSSIFILDQAVDNSITGQAAICAPDWKCTEWYPKCTAGTMRSSSVIELGIQGVSNKMFRECVDASGCGTTAGKPQTTAHCVTEYCGWDCDEWSACSNGMQRRICAHQSGCNPTVPKPAETRTCLDDKMVTATGTISGGGKSGGGSGEVALTFPAQGGPVSGRFSFAGSMTLMGTTSTVGSAGRITGTFTGGEGGTITGYADGWAQTNIPDYGTVKEPIDGEFTGVVSLKSGKVTGQWKQEFQYKGKTITIARGSAALGFTPIKPQEEPQEEQESTAKTSTASEDEQAKQQAEAAGRRLERTLSAKREAETISAQEPTGEPEEALDPQAQEPIAEGDQSQQPETGETTEEQGETSEDSGEDAVDRILREARERAERESLKDQMKEALKDRQGAEVSEQEMLELEEEAKFRATDDVGNIAEKGKKGADNLNKALELYEKIVEDEEELEMIREAKEYLKGLSEDLEDIKTASEIVQILMTEGPPGDWRDKTYEDAKPGWLEQKKRQAVNFFTIKNDEHRRAEEVIDMYNTMLERKEEQEFYSLSVQDRLSKYLYEKMAEKVKEKSKEKFDELMNKVFTKSGQASAAIILKSVEIFQDEGKKPDIGRLYRAYAEYRKDPYTGATLTHEQAVAAMKHEIQEAGGYMGIIPPGAGKGIRPAGSETVMEDAYYGLQDQDVTFEALGKIYDMHSSKEGSW